MTARGPAAGAEAAAGMERRGREAPARGKSLDVDRLRRDFPILSREVHGRKLVYLDSAATTQKPRQVIDAISDFYRTSNANIHRGLHTLAEEATQAYERTRARVARFLPGRNRRHTTTSNSGTAVAPSFFNKPVSW